MEEGLLPGMSLHYGKMLMTSCAVMFTTFMKKRFLYLCIFKHFQNILDPKLGTKWDLVSAFPNCLDFELMVCIILMLVFRQFVYIFEVLITVYRV